ncbi:Flp family type IVb pilin [Micavibrio aeruginosavorus]|uniref:Flp/Fap pilin component family protein n=1 Tax=Micavibrio aeruginosavorus (strain ARL-13) TaxID=856793 RepID=G2KLN7_MICAA|nr:Flp family type IVb pilin [Micavibrio aeruginosavorus]AEP08867.1 flp/Fap pilin component family protein [Micavibrio aeruginosavorus ARL-13]
MLFTFIRAWKEAYVKDIKGATAIEYGLIAGGISLAIVASVFLFGEQLASLFASIADSMQQAAEQVTEDTSGGTGGGTTP